MSGEDTSELATRVQRLEDVEAIGRLKAAYCDACDDDHDPDAVAALFIEDGTWQQSGRAPCEGRAAIRSHMAAIRAAGVIVRSAHLVTNPRIDVDGDEATGTWRFTMWATFTGDAGPWERRIIGRYQERYVRTRAGWRYRTLLAEVTHDAAIADGPPSGPVRD